MPVFYTSDSNAPLQSSARLSVARRSATKTCAAHLRSSAAVVALLAISLSGCETLGTKKAGAERPIAETKTLADSKIGNSITRGPRIYRGDGRDLVQGEANNTFYGAPTQLGQVPFVAAPAVSSDTTDNMTAPRSRVRTIDAYVAPLPVPQFVNAVYGEMLKVPFVAGKDVAAMTDIISLRSSGKMSAQNFQTLVEVALEEYGVRVVPENGTYKIVKDEVLRSRVPQFIKSRARARTRSDLRPVVQFVELQAVSAASIMPLLQSTFGQRGDKLKMSVNQQNNYIVLSGLPEDVNSALDVVNQLDELEFAGTQVQRYTPKYWNSTEFSAELARGLRIEGWEVSEQANLFRSIILMPVEYSNDVFIFAKSPTAQERIARWITDLDRPVKGGDTEQIFIYQVKNVDAATLAQTANSVMASSKSGAANRSGNIVLQPSSNAGAGDGFALGAQGAFTVDPLGNRIIFNGTANEYDKMVSLLEQLDTPTPEVLIEVQIAEVTLTDSTSYGVDLFIDDLGNNDVSATFQTRDGLGLGSSGANIAILTGNVDAAINAFASNRRVKILSTPLLTTQSGVEGSIQVGQDVPIISSQRAANNQNGTGATDILQAIEYRSTGILLNVTPIVFSDDRIDLTISQEVSSTVDVANSSISSPTISNRTLSTKLSLEDGATAVLGGLIQESITRDDKGVPFLKDIPVLGQVFSNDSVSKDTTELVVLITAYVLRGQVDRDQFVNRLSGRVDRALADEDRLYTLRPREF